MAQHRASSRRTSRGGNGGSTDGDKVVFSIDRANRAIPYVSRVVSDIVSAHGRAISAQAALQAMAPGADRTRHQADFGAAVERLAALEGELSIAGVLIKDQASGVVEFPTTHKGNPASLIWEAGQPAITHARLTETGPRVTVDHVQP